MKIYPFNGKSAQIGRNCVIAEDVILIGDIIIGDNCSIWPSVIIRSDTTPIRIGNNVHIEENSNLHTSARIDDDSLIGHRCMIEGYVGSNTLISSNVTLLPLSRVGANCTVAGGSVVKDMAQFPDYSFIVGTPAKVHSTLDPDNPKHKSRMAAAYIGGTRGMRALCDEYIRQGLWAVNCDEGAGATVPWVGVQVPWSQ